MLRKLTDWNNAASLSNRWRSQRQQMFDALISGLRRPVRIVDIGGTNQYWEMRGWAGRDDVQIVTINLKAERQEHPNIIPRTGNATDLSEYRDDEFDVAFSNSVIEHLFTLAQQQAMAREVQRVGKAYWVQTPNYWFPIEPHFHVPGWQWMPHTLRIWLLRHRRCGWRGPCPDPVKARALVEEVRLMSRRELAQLFPGGTFYAERLFGVVKSWVVYGGFPQPLPAPAKLEQPLAASAT
jgi:hypothetical protein